MTKPSAGLSYGELLRLTEGHGTSEIYERITRALAEKDAVLAEAQQARDAEVLHMLDQIEAWAKAALVPSSGSAWLATAREVVEALAFLLDSDAAPSYFPNDGDGQAWYERRDAAHRLLASPEVQRWAGR